MNDNVNLDIHMVIQRNGVIEVYLYLHKGVGDLLQVLTQTAEGALTLTTKGIRAEEEEYVPLPVVRELMAHSSMMYDAWMMSNSLITLLTVMAERIKGKINLKVFYPANMSKSMDVSDLTTQELQANLLEVLA